MNHEKMDTISRKRKADELDQPSGAEADRRPNKIAATEDDEPSSPPHLPASCLAAVLNFMEYSDVRKCMLAGKIMAVDAAGQVETLNIMNDSELVGPAARRFGNASEVKVLCLVVDTRTHSTSESTVLREHQTVLSVKAATQVVPFLMAFPKLMRVYIGGLFWDEDLNQWLRYPYDYYSCRQPEDHRVVYRSLLENLCGAYRSKMLRSQVNIDGIFSWIPPVCCGERSALNEERTGRPCRCCRDIIASFPFEFLSHELPGPDFCLPFHTRLKRCFERAGSKEFLSTLKGTHLLTRMLNEMFGRDNVYQGTGSIAFCSGFIEKLKNEGAYDEKRDLVVIYLLPSQLRQLEDALQRVKDEIRKIPKHSFVVNNKYFLMSTRYRYGLQSPKPIVVRQTIEGLISLGFNLDPSDYCLVDPLVEPALSLVKDSFDRDV